MSDDFQPLLAVQWSTQNQHIRRLDYWATASSLRDFFWLKNVYNRMIIVFWVEWVSWSGWKSFLESERHEASSNRNWFQNVTLRSTVLVSNRKAHFFWLGGWLPDGKMYMRQVQGAGLWICLRSRWDVESFRPDDRCALRVPTFLGTSSMELALWSRWGCSFFALFGNLRGNHLASALCAYELRGALTLGVSSDASSLWSNPSWLAWSSLEAVEVVVVFIVVIVGWWHPWFIGRLAHLGQEALNVLNELDAFNFKPLVATFARFGRSSYSDHPWSAPGLMSMVWSGSCKFSGFL